MYTTRMYCTHLCVWKIYVYIDACVALLIEFSNTETRLYLSRCVNTVLIIRTLNELWCVL